MIRLSLVLTIAVTSHLWVGCQSAPKELNAPETAGELNPEAGVEVASGERVEGEFAGALAGEQAGASAGELAGASAGESAGELAGASAGELAGESAGDLPSEPIEGCVGPMITSEVEAPAAATQPPPCVTCVGANPPNFIMRDLNPASCGVGQYYGLDAFQGEVTLVVLLRSTCGYCQAQLLKLEQLRFELLTLGHVFWLVIINEIGTGEYVSYLTDRSTSAILQDMPEVGAWSALGA